MYSKEDSIDATIEYFDGDELAAEVWVDKYAECDEDKTEFYELVPDDMHDRLIKEFVRAESKYDLLYKEFPNNFDDLSEHGKIRYMRLMNMGEDARCEFFKNFFYNFKLIVPAGSIMEALGTDKVQSYANCFVTQIPEDSVEEVYMSAHATAQIGKRRGGVGVDLSLLRPNGASLDNAAKISSGVVDWMKVYNVTGEVIGQNNRKMAMMISLDVRHPDIEEFIICKQKLNSINSANISVRVCDEFKKAVDNDEDYVLRFPCDWNVEISKIEDYDNLPYGELIGIDRFQQSPAYIKKVRAKELWNKIIHSAWATAEPGILNWDRIINYDPTSVYPKLKARTTNPCGELPLSEFDSCRLIHDNLYGIVIHPFKEDFARINEEYAYGVFYECQVQADNLVDLEIEAIDNILEKIQPGYKAFLLGEPVNVFSLEMVEKQEFQLWLKIRQMAVAGRRTGCGFTGYADMCAALGLKYGHEDTWKIFKIKMRAELDASIDMAILRGPFPLWDRDKEFDYLLGEEFHETTGYQILSGTSDWYDMLLEEFPEQAKRMIKYGRRNAGLSTVAPTGTVSIMTQTTSGIEPLFKPCYTRRKSLPNNAKKFDFQDVNGKKYSEHIVVHPKLRKWLREGNFVYEKLEKDCTLEDWQRIYEMSPYWGQCAENIWSADRIRVQAEAQKYTTASISSTINLPKSATVEDVEAIYNMVFKKGCKGVTIYREGSRAGILIDSSKTKKEECFCYEDAIKRPKLVDCNVHIITALKDRWLVLVGIIENKPYEIFALPFSNVLSEGQSLKKYKDIKLCIVKSKKRKYNLINKETTEILIEDIVSLMSNDDERTDTKQISLELRHKIHPKWIVRAIDKKFGNITSFDKAIARVLSKYIKDGEECGNLCDTCGDKLVYEGGCVKCLSCGNSICR